MEDLAIKSREKEISSSNPSCTATSSSIVFLDALESQISSLMKSIASGSIPTDLATASAVSLVDEFANNNHSDYGSECSTEELNNVHPHQITPYSSSTKKLPSSCLAQSHSSQDLSSSSPKTHAKRTHNNRIDKRDPLKIPEDSSPFDRQDSLLTLKEKLQSSSKQVETHHHHSREPSHSNSIIRTEEDINVRETLPSSSTTMDQNSQISSTLSSTESLEKGNTSPDETASFLSSSLSSPSSSAPKTSLVINSHVTQDCVIERADEESVSQSLSLPSYSGSDPQLRGTEVESHGDSLTDVKGDIISRGSTKSGNDVDASAKSKIPDAIEASHDVESDVDGDSIKSWDFPVHIPQLSLLSEKESSVTLEFQDPIDDHNSSFFDNTNAAKPDDITYDVEETLSSFQTFSDDRERIPGKEQCYIKIRDRVSGTASLVFDKSRERRHKISREAVINRNSNAEIFERIYLEREVNGDSIKSWNSSNGKLTTKMDKDLRVNDEVNLPLKSKVHSRDEALVVNTFFDRNKGHFSSETVLQRKLMESSVSRSSDIRDDEYCPNVNRSNSHDVSYDGNPSCKSTSDRGWNRKKLSPAKIFQEMKKRLTSRGSSDKKIIASNGISVPLPSFPFSPTKNSTFRDREVIKKRDDRRHDSSTLGMKSVVMEDNDERIPSPPTRERRGSPYKKRPAPQPNDHLRRLRDQQIRQQTDITVVVGDYCTTIQESPDYNDLSIEPQVKGRISPSLNRSVFYRL
jgi:translation initiation factor 2 beta subunit (eIF-2beta)/eIF-5